jgi:hypothetical protein
MSRVPRPSLGAVGGDHEGLGLADYAGDPVLIISGRRPSLGKPVGKHSDLDGGRHTQQLREIGCVGFFRHGITTPKLEANPFPRLQSSSPD